MNNDLQHMYKNPSKPEDVRVFFDEAEYIPTPELLIKHCQESDAFKEKGRECPYDTEIQVRDIQLNAHGPMEDQAYSLSPFFVKNVRRGNTVLELKREKRFVMGRKGLNKFFDMSIEYIEPATR